MRVDAGVGDLLGLDHVLGHVLLDDPSLLAADVLPRLRGDPLLQDLHLLLVDHVGVGGDLSSHDGLSETVASLDDDLLGPAVGVHGEHDPGELGVDHPLHDDGELDVLVGEALLLAVGDGPGGEQRGPALPDLVHEVVLVGDVQVGLLLSGEARVGQVLGGGAGADRDEPDLALGDQEPVPGDDLLLQVRGDVALLEDGPDLRGCLGEAVVGGPVDPGQLLVDLGHEVPAFHEVVVGLGGKHECLGHREAGVGELPEVCPLPSDYRYVFDVQLVYIHDLSVHWKIPDSGMSF